MKTKTFIFDAINRLTTLVIIYLKLFYSFDGKAEFSSRALHGPKFKP